MEQENSDYDYVLYIDEAGDDGLARVKPMDADGASEWLCIAGYLVRASDEVEVVERVRTIREDIDARQGPVLHYRKLSPTKRLRACQILAEFPSRGFALCSNKKNIKGHSNERAAQRGGKQYYYNFCVRLLMERVTDLVFRDSVKRHGSPRPMRVVFSQRGGHSYGQTKAYWELLKAQAAGGTTFLDKRVMRHDVLRFNLVEYVPHFQNAGLQLADTVASAFFQAIEPSARGLDPSGAQALSPIMAQQSGVFADYGVILQPTPPWKARLTPDQQLIFSFYGYSFG